MRFGCRETPTVQLFLKTLQGRFSPKKILVEPLARPLRATRCSARFELKGGKNSCPLWLWLESREVTRMYRHLRAYFTFALIYFCATRNFSLSQIPCKGYRAPEPHDSTAARELVSNYVRDTPLYGARRFFTPRGFPPTYCPLRWSETSFYYHNKFLLSRISEMLVPRQF